MNIKDSLSILIESPFVYLLNGHALQVLLITAIFVVSVDFQSWFEYIL